MDKLKLQRANRLHEDLTSLTLAINTIGDRFSVECIWGAHRIELLDLLSDPSIVKLRNAIKSVLQEELEKVEEDFYQL